MKLLDSLKGRIGVLGYGVVGKAVAHFLVQHKKPIALFDTESINLSDNYEQEADVITFHGPDQLPTFFKNCAFIVPSPGIDLRPYETYNNSYITELDLFYAYWNKPIIGVTGSVGKTSITSILGHLLNQNDMPTAVGGNIGIGSCDLIAAQDTVMGALLELSSFQLEHIKTFRTSIAIISNLHANHLDRHGTLENYWRSKAQLFERQQKDDLLIADWALRERIQSAQPHSTIWYIGQDPLESSDILLPHEAYWYTLGQEVHVVRSSDYQTLKKPEALFSATFTQNALIVYAALTKLCNNDASRLNFDCDNLSLPHRREKVGSHNGITFINDSKATSPIAMLAAVNQYAPTLTILLLGGLSKGVDRSGIFAELPSSVKTVACFGAEAATLAHAAQKFGIAASAHATLTDAFAYAIKKSPTGSIVLLSPAGSSYDLYKNYEERGNHFKKLVYALCAQNDCV